MQTIQTTATINPEHQLMIQVPSSIPAGKYKVVLVIEPKTETQKSEPFKFPVDDYGPWPVDLSLKREDLYDRRPRLLN